MQSEITAAFPVLRDYVATNVRHPYRVYLTQSLPAPLDAIPAEPGPFPRPINGPDWIHLQCLLERECRGFKWPLSLCETVAWQIAKTNKISVEPPQ